MRAARLMLAPLACVALLAGCGGGDDLADPQPASTAAAATVSAVQQQAVADFNLAAAFWCEDPRGVEPATLADPALAVLAEAPDAVMVGTGDTVAEVMRASAAALKPCRAGLADEVEAALP